MLVTDSNRKFVLAVATSQDLEVGTLRSLCRAAILSFSHRTSFLAGVYDTRIISPFNVMSHLVYQFVITREPRH